MEVLNMLYLTRELTAKNFCTIAYLCGKAGIEEAVKYGYRLDAPSGHYQRHLNKVLPYASDTTCLYEFSLPGCHKLEQGRAELNFTAIPAHEALDGLLKQDPSLTLKLQEKVADGHMPDAYMMHPLVLGHAGGDLPVPISIFVDGVQYSNDDSCIGVWLFNEIDGHRRLLVALRKILTCACGCRRWCTYFGLCQ